MFVICIPITHFHLSILISRKNINNVKKTSVYSSNYSRIKTILDIYKYRARSAKSNIVKYEGE